MIEYAHCFQGSTQVQASQYAPIASPYNGEIVTHVAVCHEEDATNALMIAKEAFEVTRRSSVASRMAWLEDVAKRIEADAEDLALTVTRETGKPITFSRLEVLRCCETIRLAAHAVLTLHGETIPTDATPSGRQTTAFYKRVATGVVVAITPFNFPLNLAVHKIAPALGAGCSVVLKPTPEAPMSAFKLVRHFVQSPYAIKDALSLVYGDALIGHTLVTSAIPRVISFTGSVAVGKIIMRHAGIKKVSLELGGNAATYIDKSADLSLAAGRCAMGAFINSGQVCISLQRLYVHTDIYDDFAHLLACETQKLVVGNPYDETTFMGPLINEDAALRAQRWIQSSLDQGARLVCGGRCEGTIMNPTIMADVRDDMDIVCEEVFAPIVSLIRVTDFEEALPKMNNSPYGLQYSLFSNDLNLAMRAIDLLECGGVVVNDIPTLRFDIQPYGGMKESGIGREGPHFAIEEYTDMKSVVIC